MEEPLTWQTSNPTTEAGNGHAASPSRGLLFCGRCHFCHPIGFLGPCIRPLLKSNTPQPTFTIAFSADAWDYYWNSGKFAPSYDIFQWCSIKEILIVLEQPASVTKNIIFTSPSKLPKRSPLAAYRTSRSSLKWASLTNSWEEMLGCVIKDLEIHKKDTAFWMKTRLGEHSARKQGFRADRNRTKWFMPKNGRNYSS